MKPWNDSIIECFRKEEDEEPRACLYTVDENSSRPDDIQLVFISSVKVI